MYVARSGCAAWSGGAQKAQISALVCQTVLVSVNAEDAVEDARRNARLGLDDALQGVGSRDLQVDPVELARPGEVERVHVGVRGEPGRDLGGRSGEDVDDSPGHVAGREHLGQADGAQRCASSATTTTVFPETSAGASTLTSPSRLTGSAWPALRSHDRDHARSARAPRG